MIANRSPASWQPLLVLVVLGAALAWAYWPALATMAGQWSSDPQYAHGFLVPVFAVILLWVRRPQLAGAVLRPSWWCVPVLAVGVGMRLPAETFNLAFELCEGLSLLLTLAGLCLLLGGVAALRWAGPALGFLIFMFSLPFNVERALSLELRWLATHLSTYLLQTLGMAAVAQGTTILLSSDPPLSVDEVCSGLSMLLTFVALATAVIFLFELPTLDKALILLSAAPIAILANVTRITATAFLMEQGNRELASKFCHEWAGWPMIVLALFFLALEVWLLRHLLVKSDRPRRPTNPVPMAFPRSP